MIALHNRPMRAPLSLLALPVLASLAAPPARASSVGAINVEYTGISHGMTVLKFTGSLQLKPESYSARVTFHTAGMAGWVLKSWNDSRVQGSFNGTQIQPTLFTGTGHLRDTDRITRIAYVNGNPIIQDLQPPAEQERSAVPPALTAHTIDTISAVVLLIRTVGQTGTCDGSVTTFDGRRLSTQTSHTVGRETLTPNAHSNMAGTALRCDFVGEQTGGFVKNEDQDELKKPRRGAAWLADMVPGAPPVPVRVQFDNKILGEVTLYLTSYTASPNPDAATGLAAAPPASN